MPCHALIRHSCADFARKARCNGSIPLALPRTVHTEPWVAGLRDGVRTSTAKGWGIRKEGKYVRLEVRGTGSVCLPFLWERGSVGDIQQRVRNVYALVCAGHTLKDAAERAETASASKARCHNHAQEPSRKPIKSQALQAKLAQSWPSLHKLFSTQPLYQNQ